MIKKLLISALLACGIITAAHANLILPNGKTQFLSGTGVPLAGGTVYMYIPSTTTCKTTWQDQANTVANSCPITLDANGEAQIWGTGIYRQQVYDNLNNLQWDQLTSDGTGSGASWCGTTGGTANAITATCPGFSATDGQTVCFIAASTNTGAATLSVNGGTAYTLYKDQGAGPISTVGGEVIATNQYCAYWGSALGGFHLQGFQTYINYLSKSVSVSSVGATVDLGAQGTNFITLTGSSPNTITSFGSTASTAQPFYWIRGGAGVSISIVYNSTSMILNGGLSMQVNPGDLYLMQYLGGGNWQQVAVLGLQSRYDSGGGLARQSVVSGPYDTQGGPTFLPATSVNLNLTMQNIGTTGTNYPLTIDCGNGVGGNGFQSIKSAVTSALTWSSLTPSKTLWLGLTCTAGGIPVPVFVDNATVPPIYQYGGSPSVSSGQYTFLIDQNQMYLGNGSVAVATPTVFVGIATTSGSAVTSAQAFAYNGRFHYLEAAAGLPAASSVTTFTCGLGTTVGVATQVQALNTTTDGGYTAGQLAQVNPSNTLLQINDALTCKLTNNATGFSGMNISTGNAFTMVVGDWKYQVDAWRLW